MQKLADGELAVESQGHTQAAILEEGEERELEGVYLYLSQGRPNAQFIFF